MWILLVVLPFIFVLGYPYKLHTESLNLEKSVVTFKGSFWRAIPQSVLPLGIAGLLPALASRLVQQPAASWGTLLAALIVGLPGLALGFILLRLHLSYWQHDRHATLTIHRNEQRAEYWWQGKLLNFALADVVSIITYDSYYIRNRRAALWGNYSYHVWYLKDGSQLLYTCLLYSLLGPDELVPAAQRQTAGRFICWLPIC